MSLCQVLRPLAITNIHYFTRSITKKLHHKRPRQYHGFLYEKLIISRYNLTPSHSAISKFDATHPITNTPVQIKCINFGKEICLGSLLNNQSIDQDFILHIGFWQNGKSNIIREDTLLISHEKWNILASFYKTSDMIQEFKDAQDPTPIRKQYTTIWNQHKPNSPLSPRFKASKSKGTRRVQCSIGFKDYINYIFKCFPKINLTDGEIKSTS